MSSNNTCPFILTRGIRNKQPCGKPVYKRFDSKYCLQHHRALEEMKVQQSSLIQQYLPQPSPPLSPQTIMDNAHLIEPTIYQEEVLESGETEQMTETMIDLLYHLKKDLKNKRS